MRRQTRIRIWATAIGVALCLTLGGISGIVTRNAIPTWYAALDKPFFTPPNWVFAPVWTTLYILMGIAFGWIFSYGFHHKWVKTAVFYFFVQLVLNGLWSLIFFGLKTPLWALVVLVGLLLCLGQTIRWFKVIHLKAAYLLYPYFAWCVYATALNAAIVWLN